MERVHGTGDPGGDQRHPRDVPSVGLATERKARSRRAATENAAMSMGGPAEGVPFALAVSATVFSALVLGWAI